MQKRVTKGAVLIGVLLIVVWVCWLWWKLRSGG
jgi:hypothetical protein